MTDLTLEDLAGGAAEEAAEQATAETVAESGESLMDMIEFLDERGYLGPLVFGENIGGGQPGNAPQPQPDPGEVETEGPALTAENIATFGSALTEQVGDVPLSQVVTFAQENPEQVNGLISQHLGGGGAE